MSDVVTRDRKSSDKGDSKGDKGSSGPRRRNSFSRDRKYCPFSYDGAPAIDYKDTRLLSRYISERGKIAPGRIMSVSHKRQRELANAIKRARYMGLMPYVVK